MTKIVVTEKMRKLDELLGQRQALDAAIERIRKDKAFMTDRGSPTYLDGVEMQFDVCQYNAKGELSTIAYFEQKAHAELFVSALNAKKEEL